MPTKIYIPKKQKNKSVHGILHKKTNNFRDQMQNLTWSQKVENQYGDDDILSKLAYIYIYDEFIVPRIRARLVQDYSFKLFKI